MNITNGMLNWWVLCVIERTFWKQKGMAKMPTPIMLFASVIIYPVFELILILFR